MSFFNLIPATNPERPMGIKCSQWFGCEKTLTSPLNSNKGTPRYMPTINWNKPNKQNKEAIVSFYL